MSQLAVERRTGHVVESGADARQDEHLAAAADWTEVLHDAEGWRL